MWEGEAEKQQAYLESNMKNVIEFEYAFLHSHTDIHMEMQTFQFTFTCMYVYTNARTYLGVEQCMREMSITESRNSATVIAKFPEEVVFEVIISSPFGV